MNRPLIISDKNIKSLKIKKKVKKIFKQKLLKKNNIVIVIGGDGFMLQTLKKNKGSKKLFYGVNSGSYGFLMNKFSEKNLFSNLITSMLAMILWDPCFSAIEVIKDGFSCITEFKITLSAPSSMIRLAWLNVLIPPPTDRGIVVKEVTFESHSNLSSLLDFLGETSIIINSSTSRDW